MTMKHAQDEGLAEIGRLLDTYGAEAGRWPQLARERLRQTAKVLPAQVQALVAEARALERVLEAAPRPSAAAQSRLADRIVAAAMDSAKGPAVQPAAQVIDLTRVRRPNQAARQPARPDRMRNVAALMAACLLAGIFLGGNLRLDPLLQDVADAVGLHAEFITTTTALADDSGDEDTL